MLPLHTLFLVSTNSMYLKKTRWFLWAIRTSFWPDSMPAKSHSFFLWLAMFNLTTMFELSTTSSMTDASGGAGGKLLPVHSLKWNPNDVLTTCKAISKGLASGLVHWSCALRQNHRFNGFEKKQIMAAQGETFSHYYILVNRNLFVLCRFSDIAYGFLFLLNNFPLQSVEYATYSCVKLIRTAIEQCFAANLRKVQVASRHRPFSSSCDLFIRIVLNFTFEFKVLTDRNKRSETLWSVTICLFRYDMYRCKLIFIRLSWIYLLPINLTLFPIFFISIIISIVLWCPRSAKTM